MPTERHSTTLMAKRRRSFEPFVFHVTATLLRVSCSVSLPIFISGAVMRVEGFPVAPILFHKMTIYHCVFYQTQFLNRINSQDCYECHDRSVNKSSFDLPKKKGRMVVFPYKYDSRRQLGKA